VAIPVDLVPIAEEHWAQFRTLRLEMLADTPLAFLELRGTAEHVPESEWRYRAKRAGRPGSLGLAAADPGTGAWVGTMTGFVDGADVRLVSVYVSPGYRGSAAGVTDALLAGVETWARHAAAGRFILEVHEDNPRAQAYYLRHGFEFTGRSWPYSLDPSRNELEMAKPLRPPVS
jgi:ribosomal protein S18 acetylase RimI-like enzyme